MRCVARGTVMRCVARGTVMRCVARGTVMRCVARGMVMRCVARGTVMRCVTRGTVMRCGCCAWSSTGMFLMPPPQTALLVCQSCSLFSSRLIPRGTHPP